MESGAHGAGAVGKRVIVEVRSGPMASRKGVINPGGSLRVGRAEQADLALTYAEDLSGIHFEVTWDGAACSLADLSSKNGTLLGGERVTTAKLWSGAWIRAGGVDFMVYFEAHTRPSPKHLDGLPMVMREQALAELREAMKAAPLYAVLDSARSLRILELLRESVEEFRSLYDGVTADKMAEGAPYIVRMREDSGLLSRLVLEGWGDAWGIYLTCKRPLNEVRGQFRKILMVTIEDVEGEEPVYFRFYDPRVLEAFLPICTPRQEDEVFGEVERFLYEDSDGRLVRGARAPKSSGSGR